MKLLTAWPGSKSESEKEAGVPQYTSNASPMT
jgi:hypothetical protein